MITLINVNELKSLLLNEEEAIEYVNDKIIDAKDTKDTGDFYIPCNSTIFKIVESDLKNNGFIISKPIAQKESIKKETGVDFSNWEIDSLNLNNSMIRIKW